MLNTTLARQYLLALSSSHSILLTPSIQPRIVDLSSRLIYHLQLPASFPFSTQKQTEILRTLISRCLTKTLINTRTRVLQMGALDQAPQLPKRVRWEVNRLSNLKRRSKGLLPVTGLRLAILKVVIRRRRFGEYGLAVMRSGSPSFAARSQDESPTQDRSDDFQDGRARALDRRKLHPQPLVPNGRTGQRQDDPR